MKYAQLVIILNLVQFSLQQGQYHNAAVATDVPKCSELGKQILEDGGSAVDAAITSALCLGVANPQSSGIGGGFAMVVYSNKKAEALMALERAPQAASPTILDELDSGKYGAKSIAIPAEVNGLWTAHQRYGVLEWKQLFEPVIKMAREGYAVTKHLDMMSKKTYWDAFPDIKKFLTKPDGTRYRLGDTKTFPELADTLERIANRGQEEFYTGSIGKAIINDIQEAGGIITEEDFSDSSSEGRLARWEPLTNTTFRNGVTMYSTPLSASGPVLQFLLNILDEYDITSDSFTANKPLLYHRFLEAAKFAWALRSHLGDDPGSTKVRKILAALRSKEFAHFTKDKIKDNMVTYSEGERNRPEYKYDQKQDALELNERDESQDLGDTSHISVLAANGDAVSLTTSVGWYFGSRFYSKSTGVFLNSKMSTFYRSKSSSNTVQPGRSFFSTTCPSVLVDSAHNVKLIVGASGGNRIIPANAWVILRTLWTGATVQEAIDEKRVYPFRLTTYEDRGFDTEIHTKDIHNALVGMEHEIKSSSSFAVVQAILKEDQGGINAHSDPRKGGLASGY